MKKKIEIEKVIKPPLKRARFYCRPGIEAAGYVCDGVKVYRKPNETLEELRARCKGGVEWPDDSTIHTFIPL